MNTVLVSGRLTADPELKHTASGKAATSFSLAVDRGYVRDDQRIADFFDIVAWNGTAEHICKYWRKGKWMEISGTLQTRTYTDRNGSKHKVTEIVADSVGFGGEKKENSAPMAALAPAHTPKAAQQREQRTIVPEYDPEEFEEIGSDEDLPF